MKVVSPEKKTPGAAGALLATFTLAAFSPVVVTVLLVIYVLARYRGAGARIREGSQPSIQGTPGVKTMSEVMAFLKEVPFRRKLPTFAATAVYGLIDSLSFALGNVRATAGLVFPYPDAFEAVVVESRDGTPICGLLALQQGAGAKPALIIVHGLFGSKNSHGIQALALRAYYEWGFHVFAMDLRNFGDSSRFSEAPTSWGHREADDVLAVADYLAATNRVSTVGACGVNMGAASVMLAAARCQVDGPLAGGVVALDGYADAERMLEKITTISRQWPGSVLTWLMFRFMMAFKTLAGGPRVFTDLRTYTREVSTQYYEIGEQELYRRASPVRTVGEIEVPCLIVHALDDFIVPIDEAYDLLAAAIDNPMVDSLVVPSGGHALYHLTSPAWINTTLRAFFSYWAEFGTLDEEWTGPPTDSIDTFGNPNN